MSNKTRKFMLVLAVFAALAMLMSMTSISFAGGDQPTDGKTVCVSGYVINHREQPVDGTKFEPALTVYAFGVPGTMDAASLPDMAAQFENAEALAGAADANMADAEAAGLYVATATVGADGKYEFKTLPADYYYVFALPLPTDWDGIVPVASRGGIAWTSWTSAEGARHQVLHRGLQDPPLVRRNRAEVGRTAERHRAGRRGLDHHGDPAG